VPIGFRKRELEVTGEEGCVANTLCTPRCCESRAMSRAIDAGHVECGQSL
jgi:hypothetical protein